MNNYVNEVGMDFNRYCKNMEKYKRIIVIWSGGYDSTLALINILPRAKENNIPVTVISIEHSGINNDKNKAERKARKAITKKLNNRGYNFGSTNITIIGTSFTSEPFGEPPYRSGFTQPQIWISSITPYLTDNTLLVFGYIRGDDLLLQKDNFLKLLDLQVTMGFKQPVDVTFPFKYTNKYTILDNLMYDYNDIFKLCWTCEAPDDGEPCGWCHSCETELQALRYLQVQKENRLKYSDKLCDFNNIRNQVLKDINNLNKAIVKKEKKEYKKENLQKDSKVVTLQKELSYVGSKCKRGDMD